MGIDVSGIPEQFDPAFLANSKRQATTEMQRIDNEYKAKKFDLDERQFGEVKRGNRAQEADRDATRAQSKEQFNVREARERATPPAGSAAATQLKPMPTAALKMQQADLDAIGIASATQADLSAIEQQVKDGKLDFGPISNLADKGLNMAGYSTEASRNKASFKSSLEKMRNDSLRLNTGVQTDGDAQRAWNELFENINDEGVVLQRLGEIKRINARAVQLRKMNVDGIRANYGRDPVDTSKYEGVGSALGAKPVQIKNAADYAKVPSGAEYITPDGVTQRKK